MTSVTGMAPLQQAGTDPDEARRSRYTQLLQKKALLEREMALKSLQLELAEDAEPYLVFDLEDREIRIYVRVTAVHTLPLVRAEMEQPETAPGAEPEPWLDVQLNLLAKSGDEEGPERIDPEAAGIPSGEEINPRSITPEIAGIDEKTYPPRYSLLFRQGVAVHIGPEGGGEGDWLRQRISKLASLLTRPDLPQNESMDPVHTWIHLTMDEDEARNLYPSTFAGMRAMVRLPGDPAF